MYDRSTTPRRAAKAPLFSAISASVEEAIFFLCSDNLRRNWRNLTGAMITPLAVRGYIRRHMPENNCRFSRDRGMLREEDRLSEIAPFNS